jgi:alpha-tubulin suppressor-like RCC1 family protein/pimeloyl-ACP methyl ester carboxylesterase
MGCDQKYIYGVNLDFLAPLRTIINTMVRESSRLGILWCALVCQLAASAAQSGSVVGWGAQVLPLTSQTHFVAVSAGRHLLALKSDGTVVAWGDNYSGQSTVPAGLSGVTAIAGGYYHSVALKSDGTVVAWGGNDSGQSTAPAGLSGVTAIAAGGFHSLALKSDGTVVAWGDNDSGQSTVPAGLSGVTAIAGGYYHSLALKSDGTVVAWGGLTTVPVGLSGVTAIAAVYDRSLALKSDGTVVAWGIDWYGYGLTTVPVGLSGVTAIEGGYYHNLALKTDGTVVAWGDNGGGQTTVPVGLSAVIAIAAGVHSLALKSDGTVVAWGSNDGGQSTVPVGLSGVIAIAAGAGHSLALKSDGTVVAWGDNHGGQITVPVGLSGVIAIAAGDSHSLALKSDGTVVAWGGNDSGQSTVPVGLSGVIAIAAGGFHSLALKSDGTVVAWGGNDSGQSTVPVGLSGVTAIAAATHHSLAITTNGIGTEGRVVILSGPEGRHARLGETATFRVFVSGTGPLSYQWYKDGVEINGAKGWRLIVTDVQWTKAGQYSVLVRNAYGSVISDAAQLTVLEPLSLAPTSLIPTTAQSTPAILQTCPITSAQLKILQGETFVTDTALDPSKMTVVLTHGWNSDSSEWGLGMAQLVRDNIAARANIVAWDWSCAAKAFVCNPLSGGLAAVAGQSGPQGRGLAEALRMKLGPGYSQPLHFIGHSLGTLVNARAADALHAQGFAWIRTHMTLLDEAEAATELGCLEQMGALTGLFDPLSAKPYYGSPLPEERAWADNYVSFAGMLKPEAANVILTKGFPTIAPTLRALFDSLSQFHSYPCGWYSETILTDVSPMGHRWSFERGGLMSPPALGKVYVQVANGSEWELVEKSYHEGEQLLDQRLDRYRTAISVSGASTLASGLIHGTVSGTGIYTSPVSVNMVLRLITSGVGLSPLPHGPHRFSAGPQHSEETQVPAYAWIPIGVPSNAVAMSFEFEIEGDGQTDSFAAAIEGTNVLSVQVSLLPTNEPLSSGMIDVAQFRGLEVEFFAGVVGGASTNASVTVSKLKFYTLSAPALQAETWGSDVVITWPLAADSYMLETTPTLAPPAWVTVTNAPAVSLGGYVLTNSWIGPSRFFRLRAE